MILNSPARVLNVGVRIFASFRNQINQSRPTNFSINGACFSSKPSETEPEIPKNNLVNLYSASSQAESGKIYDKKPFRMRLEKGKKYSWCLCGHSKSQPLCDGTHKNPYIKYKQRPIRFEVSEDKEYWLCNCKQTSNRPFCDGTHKREDIQAAVK